MHQLSLPYIDSEGQIFDEAYKMYRCGTVDFFAESFTLYILPLIESYLARVSPETQPPDDTDRKLIEAAYEIALQCYCTDRVPCIFCSSSTSQLARLSKACSSYDQPSVISRSVEASYLTFSYVNLLKIKHFDKLLWPRLPLTAGNFCAEWV